MKRKLILGQCLAVLMILCVGSVAAYAQTLSQNGVAYVLLGNEFDQHGVYRLNNYDSSASVRAAPYKLFDLNAMPGKVSGLSANQQKQVFLLAGPLAGEWADAEVGWLPTGMKFEDDSPIYIKTMLPNDPEGGVTGLRRDGTPHGTNHWKTNHTIAGVTYDYAVDFGGPTEVKYLNGVSGVEDTPIWPGTFSPTTGLAHPTDPRKVIVPSHWAAVAYYAYGTVNHPEFPGQALDGTIGNNGNVKPTILWSQANAGHQSPNTFFACIVKRIYKKRTKSLDLYSTLDTAAPPPSLVPALQSAGMLSSIDVNVTEAYGKYCGDNCIPGGSIGQNSIMTQLSTVRVVTSTKGARYGFNPQGIRKTPSVSEINAALRVVKPGSSVTEALSISTDNAGTTFNSTIVRNSGYLASIGITPANLKTIGVSSDFSTPTGLDYLYGSDADKFVVQDSWWGRGGIAYEYFADTGAVRKLDYMANDIPIVEELGVLSGKIDDIGIDGEGYLYVMRTEKVPSDASMANADVNFNNPAASPQFLEISTTWLRPPAIEGSTSDPTPIAEGSQQPKDFKIITLKQDVFKTVKRYPQGAGSLGTEEDRGQVPAGFDLWTRSIEVKADNSIGWKHVTWSVEEEGDRDSSFPGELAVVNLAKVPDVKAGSDFLNVIAIGNVDDSSTTLPNENYTQANPGQTVKEHSTMTFKVEGYKPYIDGVLHDLKPIGDIVDPNTGVVKHANVKLNAIPNKDGDYTHDENNDGSPSGFPSSMFESSTKKTVVKWKISLVENNAIPANLSDLIILDTFPDVTGTGEFKALNFTFQHPGNYMIKAEVTYHKFDFSGLSASVRPHELNDSTSTVTTAPFLVKVFSESLNLNKSPSYITNIQIKPTTRTRLHGVANSSENGTGLVNSLLDFEEDKPLGGIEITFDAQFVRDANRETNVSAALATFDGIGVWDYKYYARLYNEIPNQFPGLPYSAPATVNTPLDETAVNHVYNYDTGGDPLVISSKIKTDVYNPGRPKPDSALIADNGTRVDSASEPNNRDWSFIQWGLYLQPTGPYGLATPTSSLDADGRHTRGILIAQGACNDPEVVKTLSGDRKYSVRIPIDSSKFSQIIKTPKDPETFSLHLEMIYPRVSWLSNDLDDTTTAGEKRFSSMVPLSNSEGDKPFHILGRMRLAPGSAAEPGTNILINQSWKNEDTGEQFFVGGKESFGTMARDFTLPKFVEAPNTNATPVIQTTGDDVEEVEVTFAVYDNNPHAEIGEFYPAYEMIKIDPITELPVSPFDSSDSNKVFRKGPVISQIVTHKGPETTEFFSSNSWEAGASFTTKLIEYGPGKQFDRGKTLQNWIGSLNYTVIGSIKDGIGSYSTIVEHQFYHPKAWNDIYPGVTVSEDAKINIDSALVKAVERYDNDPPSIEVELVSQVDNRRWVIKLIENINDAGPVPTTVDKLGKCILQATSYNLQTNAELNVYEDLTLDGFAAYPSDFGDTDINLAAKLSAAVPAFRRASRLLVNVKIYDNTGFRELQTASIKITNNDGTESNLLPSNSPAIPLMASQDLGGNTIASLADRPRASYAVDMPMKALPEQNQVTIEIFASDQNNNRRKLIIPIKVVESTFDTRVLEIKENRN